MEHDQLARMIESLEALKRASRRAQLTPGDIEGGEIPCGWWIREDE